MKNYKLVSFKWADTTSPSEQSWFREQEAKDWAKNDSYWVHQVGFLIENKKEYILLAGNINVTHSAGEDLITLGHLIKIPTTWIKDFKYLK